MHMKWLVCLLFQGWEVFTKVVTSYVETQLENPTKGIEAQYDFLGEHVYDYDEKTRKQKIEKIREEFKAGTDRTREITDKQKRKLGQTGEEVSRKKKKKSDSK